MNAVPFSFHTYYMWLIVIICLAAFITAIVRLGNFRKEENEKAKTDLKMAYDMALDHQKTIANEFGSNSKELLAAKNLSMEIFKQMVSLGIEE